MIAGALGSLTLLLTIYPVCNLQTALRASAVMTVGIGIGGSMTYGQTVGLTHDQELVGNWAALRWGLLGLFVKGGIWIGFGATFFAMAIGQTRYQARELSLLLLALSIVMFAGIAFLNQPFDPENKVLPAIYFSDSWTFEPNGNLKPRPEVWGGLAIALAGLLAYTRLWRGDKLALRLGIAGVIAGGLGFSGGQLVQASHAWNPDLFTTGTLGWASGVTQYFNWWNMMETCFGAIWGAGLALAFGWNLHLLETQNPQVLKIAMFRPLTEVVLLTIHVGLVLIAEFANFQAPYQFLELYTEFGIILAAVPIVGCMSGKIWPAALMSLVVVLPIAGKTFLRLTAQGDWATDVAATLTILLPSLAGIILFAWLLGISAEQLAVRPLAVCLLFLSSVFFWLNTAVFEFAWPWKTWTGRTPNQIIFLGCWLSLTIFALRCVLAADSDSHWRRSKPA